MSANSLISKNRLEAFSDGVFAIIITLLVLEIKVPVLDPEISSSGLLQILVHELPAFISWVISFLIVAVFWINHHRFFEELKHTDNGIVWLNVFLLLCVSFVPFPSGLIGNYHENQTAVVLFGGVMICASFVFSLMRFYVLRKRELYKEGCEESDLRKRARRSLLMGPGLWGMATACVFINPVWSLVLFGLIPVYFIIPKN